jgi:hypothetical protein
MTTYTYTPSLTSTNISGSYFFPRKVFTGSTTLTFDLTDINDSENQVLKVLIDYGDSSKNILIENSIVRTYADTDQTVRIAETNQFSDGLDTFEHTYHPSSASYYMQLSAQVLLYFANYTTYRFVFPITISQDSYFSVYEKLLISNTQFIDLSSNDVYAILQSNTGDIYNVVLTK